MRFHALAIPHTITNKDEFVACAYTQKVLKFCEMMLARGHEVYHYGHVDSNLVCTEHVSVVTRETYNKIYGTEYHKSQCFKFDQNDEVYQEYNRNAIEEIKKRREFGDFILAFWGWGNKPICDAFEGDGQTIIVEPGIGYCSTFAKYRIFESYTMLHLTLGMGCCQQSGGIPAYSTVIPNYFDPKDFEFKEIKKDYFLCLGRISKCKGVDHAIQVTAKIGARLVIAGQGSYKDLDLEAWPDHVEYVGYALPEKRKELMKNAKGLFILSTYIEPFGGAMVESFFCGTPVISSDIGSFVENNLHGITGYRCRTFGQMVWAAQNIHRIDPKACLNWAQNFTTERIAGLYEEYFQSTKDGWYGEVRSVPLLQLKEFPRVPKKQNKIAIWLFKGWAQGRHVKAMLKYLEADFYDWSNWDDNSNLWIHGAWKQYDSIISNTTLLSLKKIYGIDPPPDMIRRFVPISFFPVFDTMSHFKETLENFPSGARYGACSKEIQVNMRARGVPDPKYIPMTADPQEFPERHVISGPIKRIGIVNGRTDTEGEYYEVKGIRLFEEICAKGGYEPVHIRGRNGYIYHDIDLLVCCSKHEGGPNGLFEAACSGVPVLTRRVGCAQEVDGIALFDTAEDALHQIANWNSSISELKEYTARITKEVRANWGLDTCIEKYLKPLLNTLGGVPGLLPHFTKLNSIVADTWLPGRCGSYLIDGSTLDYDITTLPKQKILYDICKNSKNFLEIGMYMGHSALLALLANDRLKYTGIDICECNFAKTETCAEYLQKTFGERFKFLKGSSLDLLHDLKTQYDVIHVDGNHNPDFVKQELDMIIENNLLDGMIIFDDYDMIKSYIDNEHRLKIIQISENCSSRNCVCVLNTQNEESMKKCAQYTMTSDGKQRQTLESVEYVLQNNMDQLRVFSAGSVNDSHELWLRGAGQFITQIDHILEHINYKFEIIDINEYKSDNSRLGEILVKNGSDKALLPWHNYHIFYSYILNLLGIESKLNILEIGLGTNNPTLPSTMGTDGRPGASLYAWREYLTNSNIYGADIDKDILFESDRIKTFYVDQLNASTFSNIPNIKYDLIIDDGLHSIGANLNTLLFALDHLAINGWLVIEDIEIVENWKIVDFILKSKKNYKTYVINAMRGYLYVINKC